MTEQKDPNIIEEITGTIEYKLIRFKDHWKMEYNRDMNNDIAGMCIAQNVSGDICAGIEMSKIKAKEKGETKLHTHFKNILEKSRQGKFGLSVMVAHMQDTYAVWKSAQDKQKAAKEAKEVKLSKVGDDGESKKD